MLKKRRRILGVMAIGIDVFPVSTSAHTLGAATLPNRWWSTWYWDTARDEAAFHLMVDFHGANKPTGMERTWPNAITREGVRGHEYQITRYHRHLEPEHDTILPFTRFVAGPGDYTPTVFESKELQGNTWGHELAQAIIFTSPYLCFGGHPATYLANPAKDVIEAIPSVWDETLVLPGSEPGKLVAEARRSGDRWFIAVINGGQSSSLGIPLRFLGKGPWQSTQLFDNKTRPDTWDTKHGKVSAADHITLDLSPQGGFVAWIRKQPRGARRS